MTIQEIYQLAIEKGMQTDFREKSVIKERLKRFKQEYEKLPKEEQRLYDKEKFINPYLDTAIHYASSEKRRVKRIMVGIDIDSAELLVARQISQDNPKKSIDLVMAHHPVGKALAGLDGVMDMQVDALAEYGIPENVAEGLLNKRISEVSRGLSPINHYKSVDAARLLNMNFMNVHTPSDNMVAHFLRGYLEKKSPKYVGDILNLLMEIPEYQIATAQGAGPRLFSGSKENRAGKIAITEVTGGTEGSPEIYERLAHAGVGTVIAMHQSEKHKEEAEKAHVNVVIAGHMSSDSIGMNLFLDELEKKGIEIVPCSGLIRHSRIKGIKRRK